MWVLLVASRGSWFSSLHLQNWHDLWNLEAEWILWGLDHHIFAIYFYKPPNGHCMLQRGNHPLSWSQCHFCGETQAFGCTPPNGKTLLRWVLLGLPVLTGLAGCNRHKRCTTDHSRIFCVIYSDQSLSKHLSKCKVQKQSYFRTLFSLQVLGL